MTEEVAPYGCNHSRYRQRGYMQLGEAWKALRRGEVCFVGKTITHCEDCGADIFTYRLRKVMTTEEYLRRR